jgi:hypothetical protein
MGEGRDRHTQKLQVACMAGAEAKDGGVGWGEHGAGMDAELM